MITLIHILADSNLSGAPIHVLHLTKGLTRKQFRSIIICPPGPIVEHYKAHNIAVYEFNFSSKWQFGNINRLKQLIQKIATDRQTIVHCHGVRAGLFGRLAARSLSHPVIYTEHSWTKDYHLPNPVNETVQKSMLRFLDRYTRKTIAVSQAVADFLIAEKICPQNKTIVIHNGVELPKKQLPLQDNRTLGSIGSLTWQKNHFFLIDAIAQVSKQLPDIKAEIIGEGPQRLQLEDAIRGHHLERNITLLGAIPHERLPEYYKNWSLYIQCSTNESFGLALAEAVAHGLPSISTAVGSIPEILGDKTATFPYDKNTWPYDVDQAVQLIINLLEHKEKREQLAKSELVTVSQFSITKMVYAHQELYKQIVG